MKKALFVLLISSMSTVAQAERFTDVIHSFSEGAKGQEHLLFLESGRVVFVKPTDGLNKSDFRPGEKVQLKTNHRHTLVKMKSIGYEVKSLQEPVSFYEEDEKASILPDIETANSIFNGMNRTYKSKTECSDRAHVWAYEEWKKHGLISKKVFLFFTNTYIRNYRFNWWFHVSPYTMVNENETTVDYVLDKRYTKVPYKMKDWTDIFVRSKKSCSERTYRYYRANKNSSEHCYITKTPMYYRIPYHVRHMEDNGVIKTRFSQSEVNFSYRAFSRSSL